jgi:hypothetical protein
MKFHKKKYLKKCILYSKYMETIKDYITLHSTLDKIDDEYMNGLMDIINNEFPNAPFNISLDDEELLNLDEPFTNEKVIFIKDGRQNEYSYYYKQVILDGTINKYCDYMKIEQINNNPITLRQIINNMIKSEHYNDDDVKQDDHKFLEGFEKQTDIQYEVFFGS